MVSCYLPAISALPDREKPMDASRRGDRGAAHQWGLPLLCTSSRLSGNGREARGGRRGLLRDGWVPGCCALRRTGCSPPAAIARRDVNKRKPLVVSCGSRSVVGDSAARGLSGCCTLSSYRRSCLRSGGSVDVGHLLLECSKSEQYLVWRVRAGSRVTGSSRRQRIVTENLGGSGVALLGPLRGDKRTCFRRGC